MKAINSGMRTKVKRLRFDVPEDETEILDWLSHQYHVSSSIRVLIKNHISEHGISDVTIGLSEVSGNKPKSKAKSKIKPKQVVDTSSVSDNKSADAVDSSDDTILDISDNKITNNKTVMSDSSKADKMISNTVESDPEVKTINSAVSDKPVSDSSNASSGIGSAQNALNNLFGIN